MGEAETTYRVLGPLSAVIAGRRVKLGGKRQRMVLAMLVADAGRVVSQDSLVEAVWNGSAPASGNRSLHTYVSNLRRLLDGGIERDGEGYVLQVEDREVDARRFDACLADGRKLLVDAPDEAARLLQRGLGLWTGPAYGDLGTEQALVTEANRLAAERLEALELRFEADLSLGRHAQIVPEMEALLREEPLREHLALMLMLAMYRSGRPADALRVYQQVRASLVEELGIEPSSELQGLELQIIERDPGLALGREASVGRPRGARGYELHERTGRSEFGDRHRGFQGIMAREVSVLTLATSEVDTAFFIRQFDTELQTVAALEHPNLAPVLDYWRDSGSAHIVTPHYRGGTLEALLLSGPLDVGTAVRIADRLASALDFVHRQGYTHGAVTSRAVLLDEERNPYLADLGLSRAVGSRPDPQVSDDMEQLGMLVLEMLGEDRSAHPEVGHALARACHPEPELRFGTMDAFSRALRQSAGLDVQPFQVQPPADVERRNPYKGLAAFHEADAADFHGRDELVEELIAGLDGERLLAVVGPSGSGKSSVVRAGLLPRVRAGAITGSETWLVATMFPGSHPFEALAEALQRVSTTEADGLWARLTACDAGLVDAVDLVLPEPGDTVLLVIDQFEELFSAAVPAAERSRFLAALTDAVSSDGRVRVVVTLRADFFDHPLSHPGFAAVFRERVVAVGPPTADGLARAISQPAIRAGVSLEAGLVGRIVAEVLEEPGALPSLQFLLTELFARRTGDVMTLKAYESLGGVGGVLASRAEETHAELTATGRELARQLFLRLVTVDELADDTRRRVSLSELQALEAEVGVGAIEDLINRFAALRFLSFDRDPVSRAPTVELAHEALLHRWQRLASWIGERREDLLIHRRLQITVYDWRAGDEDPSFLLRGSRLEQAQAWLERTDLVVSDDERRLLDVSERIEDEEREAQASLKRVAARRRQLAVAVLAAAAVLAGVLGTYAFWQRGQAVESAEEATRRELALASLTIAEDDAELAMLLALEALEIGDRTSSEPLPEVLGALWSAYVAHRVELAVDGVGDGGVVYHPDGAILAVDAAAEGGDGMITLRNATTGEELASLPSRPAVADGSVESMEFSSDGSILYVGRNPTDENPTPVVEIFDVANQTLVTEVSLRGDTMLEIGVADSGLVVAPTFIEDGTEFAIYDPAADAVITRIADDDLGAAIASYHGSFLPGSDELVFVAGGDEGPRLVTLDARRGTVLDEVPIDVEPMMVAVDPEGRRVALGDIDHGRVVIVDLETGEPTFPPVPHQNPQAVHWSIDGALLAVSGNESDITVIDGGSGRTVLTLSGHKAAVYSTDFHPGRGRLASVSIDGELRVWNITAAGRAGLAGELGDIARLDASDEVVIAGVVGDGVHVVDAATGELVYHHEDFLVDSYSSAKAAGGAGGLVAGSGPASSTPLVDGRTGELVEQLPPCTTVAAFSPDGGYVLLDYFGPEPGDESACTGGQPTGVLDRSTGQLVVDRNGEVVPWGAISGPDTFSGRRYAALTIYSGVDDYDVEIYSIEPTRLLATLTADELGVESFLLTWFTPDARYLGIGTNGPSAVVVDIEALEGGASLDDAVVFNREVHTGNAAQVRVTPEGVVATTAFDGWYRFWDLESGELRFEIEVTGLQGFSAFAFSPDHRTFYYEDGNGVVRAMPTDVDELIELASSSVTRGLTDDECRRYLHIDACEPG